MSNIVFNNKSLKGFLDINNISWKNIRENGCFAIKVDLSEANI